ncbi:MAG: hypothetical protein AB1641_22760 [Thermodesulfobacteriota bacterium]
MRPSCQKCGRLLQPGELSYQVKIELVSTFDGYIEESPGDVDQEIDKLLETLAHQNPKQAADDVAQTIMLTLCRNCRNRLVKEYDMEAVRVVH